MNYDTNSRAQQAIRDQEQDARDENTSMFIVGGLLVAGVVGSGFMIKKGADLAHSYHSDPEVVQALKIRESPDYNSATFNLRKGETYGLRIDERIRLLKTAEDQYTLLLPECPQSASKVARACTEDLNDKIRSAAQTRTNLGYQMHKR